MKMTDSELKTWQLKLQINEKKKKTTVTHLCLPVWGSVISFCDGDGLFPPAGIDGNNLSIVSLLPW